MKKLFVCTMAVLSLAACKTTAEGDHGKITVQDGHYHDGHGDFCPPGQAKKGNC